MAGEKKFPQNKEPGEGELEEQELESVVGGGSGKDSISDMNSQDMLRLQRLMDQKSQLEQTISNTMKASFDSTTGIISNQKSS